MPSSFYILRLYPFLGKAFFPRTDPGQFVVNVKVPAGTRIELTDDYVARRWKTRSAQHRRPGRSQT